MPFSIEDSDLWKRTLASRPDDPHSDARDILRTTLLQMRTSVGRLITEIPADCRDLTVHDVTHLDALWEMADLILGDEYELTPVEAFVFGASVLLHDAGLTFAAFPGGLASLKDTIEWKDTAEAFSRRARLSGRPINPLEADAEISFEVLRRLHAEQAEKLASQSWSIGAGSDKIYLISDVELRQAYGLSIGKIAHSHHWSIDKIADELRDGLGASPDLPKSWILSERRVACLLRCADIAHLDRRRAPTILLASKSLSGISMNHWNFQNKINKPVYREGSLVYNSGVDFEIDDSDSWWLAYEVLLSVDKELRASSALLSEQRLTIFPAQRVAGSDTPRSLSKFITTKGWKPVDTEIRVTDPIHLAKTLGGANLYGSDVLAPIRELIQNSVDSVRARRRMERRPPGWGSVVVNIVQGENGSQYLVIDDNGTGMSERVLTGPLLDFGKSLWSSNLLQEEFPGLQTLGIDPVGKFGIGFFSIFLLGDEVTVTTRKYSATEPFKTLIFNGLSRRPVLRDSSSDEIPLDYSTRIKVKLKSSDVLSSIVDEQVRLPFGRSNRVFAHQVLRTIISCVDVSIKVSDVAEGIEINHDCDWKNIDPREFLAEISSDVRLGWAGEEIISAHRDLMTDVMGEDGVLYGRAALNVTPSLGEASRHYSRVSVGGFVTSPPEADDPFYIGVMMGETNVASRSSSEISVPESALRKWANEQYKLIDRRKIHPRDQLSLCHKGVDLGADTVDLPFCMSSSGLLNVSQFREKLSNSMRVLVPVTLSQRDYRSEEIRRFVYTSLSSLSQDFLFYRLRDDFVGIIEGESDVLQRDPDEDQIDSEIITAGSFDVDLDNLITGNGIDILLKEITASWGSIAKVSLIKEQHLEMDLYRKPTDQWALKLDRPEAS